MWYEKIWDWCFGIGICLLLSSPFILIWWVIYKDVHCWGLDPATAPIECQRTNTLNVNGVD